MKMKYAAGRALVVLMMASVCQAKEPPTQVVYRFDDHRYLELKGWDCEGELWYTDTLRGIHSEPVSQFYRIFTKKFVHPSERYIAITGWGVGGFRVSKDYGKTWQVAQFSPGENEPDGMNSPPRDDVLSFTVVNDQGFLQTKQPLFAGPAWGLVYITKEALENDTAKFHTNYQNLPDKVPEVKGYTGWDHMRCDMGAGR